MLYLSEAESAERVESVMKDLKSKTYKLNPFPSEFTLILEANGKIACLKNKNGDEVLTFSGKKDSLELIFRFYLPNGSDRFVAL
jgi:histidinol-phosphate/aromatic aminotransferase/cobyric acid decarboxylase-like protein